MRKLIRWSFRLFLVFVLLIAGTVLFFGRHALVHRFRDFPAEANAWEEVRKTRGEVSLDDGWTEYTGVFHSHSKISHDSVMEFEQILAAAKEAGIHFIFMSDHCVDGKADFGIQWRGLHEGVLFSPGYEMGFGYLAWGLPSETVIDCGLEAEALAKAIVGGGGTLGYAHSEEERYWEWPYYSGMEIYNIHTDVKEELEENVMELVPDLLLNRNAYPELTFRLIFDRQTAILQHWDELNKTRNITGFAASDAHQNVGIRIQYVDGRTQNAMQFQVMKAKKGGEDLEPGQDYLVVGDTGPKIGQVVPLNGFTRFLATLALGELQENKDLFRMDFDNYTRSLRFVRTHLLSTELSETALLEAFKDGRGYIAFDMIMDSTGFVFMAAPPGGERIVMGQEAAYVAGAKLEAAAAAPGRFTVMHDGEQVYQAEGKEISWEATSPGKYRVEVELKIGGEWTPWIYTNPLHLTGATQAPDAAAPEAA